MAQDTVHRLWAGSCIIIDHDTRHAVMKSSYNKVKGTMLHAECKNNMRYEFSFHRKYGYRIVQGTPSKHRAIIEAENADDTPS